MKKDNKQKISFFLLYLYGGGGERVALDLMRGFLNKGHEVHLVLMKREGQLAHAIDERVKVFDFQTSRIISTLPKLTAYMKKEKPTAMISLSKHTHIISLWAKMISGVQTKILMRIGIPYSIGFYRNTNWREFFVPFLVKMFYPKAHRILPNSQGMRHDFLETVRNVPPEKVQVIYNPKFIENIERSGEEPVDHPWFSKKKEPVFIAMGRLTEQKDFATMVRAFAKVRQKAPCKLAILGSGADHEPLLALAKSLGVGESVDVLGFQENPYKYMARSDIFVSTSLWEGLPNNLIEAMALGLPAIATDCTWGPREVIAPDTNFLDRTKDKLCEEEYGILVPTGNVELVAEAMEIMLLDENKREKYAKKSKKRSYNFSAENIVEQYQEVIEKS